MAFPSQAVPMTARHARDCHGLSGLAMTDSGRNDTNSPFPPIEIELVKKIQKILFFCCGGAVSGV
jgi:hypothetical protein